MRAAWVRAEGDSVTLSDLDRIPAWSFRAIGARALRAITFARESRGEAAITRGAVLLAASWLAAGDKRGGVARPWPMLAARLRKVAREAVPS